MAEARQIDGRQVDGRGVDGRVVDDRPWGEAVHATAVAIDGAALVIVGASRAGKSRLAWALLSAATRARPIGLVGDDRILLARRRGRLVARPHPRIAGFLEARDIGLFAMAFVAAAPVGGLIALGRTSPAWAGGQNFPCWQYVTSNELLADGAAAGAGRVLDWWDGHAAAPGLECNTSGRNRAAGFPPCAKD